MVAFDRAVSVLEIGEHTVLGDAIIFLNIIHKNDVIKSWRLLDIMIGKH